MNAWEGIMHLGHRLSRFDVLTPAESDLLCRAAGHAPRYPHRVWTRRDDRELVRLVEKRLSAPEIAKICDRTPFAVRTRKRDLRRLGQL